MLRRIAITGCWLVALGSAFGCGGDDESSEMVPAADGSTSDAVGQTQSDGGEDGARTDSATSPSGDSAVADSSTEGSVGDEATSDALSQPGPGGDGGLALGAGDAASADASFQVKNGAATNLLSMNDVHASCSTVAGASTGTFP